MMEMFDFLNNVPFLYEALQFLVAFHAAAIVIVNMTDTPKDNEMLAKVYRYIEFLAGIVKPQKVKQPTRNEAAKMGLVHVVDHGMSDKPKAE